MLSKWFSYKTHCHICGTSRSGKSKFCELCIRQHIKEGNGVALIDWTGSLFDDLLPYLAYIAVRRPVYLLNPSEPTRILPYDPFALPDGWEPSAHISRITELIGNIWGAKNLNETPTLESTLGMALAAKIAMKEPLHHINMLLRFPKKELREQAIEAMTDDLDDYKQDLVELQYLQSLKEFRSEVGSTRNRLRRFVRSKSIRLFTGLGSSFNVAKAVRERAIVLVNVMPSRNLSAQSARIFAALLLSDFLQAARDNAKSPVPYYLYLDECQSYLTDDAAEMLDQALRSGLRMTFIHHHMGQFHERVHLQQSLETNARIDVAFAGLPVEAAKRNAEQYDYEELNKPKKKRDTWTLMTEQYEVPTESMTKTKSDHGDSESTTMGTRAQSFQRFVKNGQEDYTREERIAQSAARYQSLQSRQCIVHLPDRAYPYTVPTVIRYLPNPDTVLRFMQDVTKSYIPLHEAEIILKEKERAFLERSKGFERGPGRPKKKPAYLHPQG